MTDQFVAVVLLVPLCTAIVTLLVRRYARLQQGVSLLGSVGYLVAVAVLFGRVVLPPILRASSSTRCRTGPRRSASRWSPTPCRIHARHRRSRHARRARVCRRLRPALRPASLFSLALSLPRAGRHGVVLDGRRVQPVRLVRGDAHGELRFRTVLQRSRAHADRLLLRRPQSRRECSHATQHRRTLRHDRDAQHG